jgi:hypothetical protein
METLVKFLGDLLNTPGVSGTWITACLGVASVGVLVFYIIKSIILLQSHTKVPDGIAMKDDVTSARDTLQDDNKYVLKILEGINERIKRDVYERLISLEDANDNLLEICRQLEAEMVKVQLLAQQLKTMQDEESKTSTEILHDVNGLVSDSRAQHSELARQVQALQVDLASLHGTLIGLNTQRSRLK